MQASLICSHFVLHLILISLYFSFLFFSFNSFKSSAILLSSFIVLSFIILTKFFIYFNIVVFGIFSNLSIIPLASYGQQTSYRLQAKFHRFVLVFLYLHFLNTFLLFLTYILHYIFLVIAKVFLQSLHKYLWLSLFKIPYLKVY